MKMPTGGRSRVLGQMMILGYMPPSVGPRSRLPFWEEYGIVIGAVVLVAVVLALFLSRCRRKRDDGMAAKQK